jgi:hypothetical protein
MEIILGIPIAAFKLLVLVLFVDLAGPHDWSGRHAGRSSCLLEIGRLWWACLATAH